MRAGFVITVLGKQQLFTETTLTAMLPVFYQPRWKSVGILLRMWAIVLVANIAGTLAFAFLLSSHDLFNPEIRHSLTAASALSINGGGPPTILKAMLAGWLIALMVWVLPSAGSAGLFIIVLMTYVIALGQFFSHYSRIRRGGVCGLHRRGKRRRLLHSFLSADHHREFVWRGRLGRPPQSRARRARNCRRVL